jgi:hypothetical protein
MDILRAGCLADSFLRTIGSAAAVFLAVAIGVGHAYSQELWFSPGDDLPVNGNVARPDFARLFDQDASWPTGYEHIDVFQSRAPYFLRMPEETKKMLTFLQAHHIALAIPLSVLAENDCGRGVEGIMPLQQITVYARETKARNIRLAYLVMDEPLFYGHDYAGHNACRLPVNVIAERVSQSLAVFRQYFPTIRFILCEPVQALAGGPNELAEFLDLLHAKFGEYPASLRLDIAWYRDWRRELPPMIGVATGRGMGYGVIFDADRGQFTDADWIASAERNVGAFRGAMAKKPVRVIIQSWNRNPVRLFPETDPSTMTGFLKWYINNR